MLLLTELVGALAGSAGMLLLTELLWPLLANCSNKTVLTDGASLALIGKLFK